MKFEDRINALLESLAHEDVWVFDDIDAGWLRAHGTMSLDGEIHHVTMVINQNEFGARIDGGDEVSWLAHDNPGEELPPGFSPSAGILREIYRRVEFYLNLPLNTQPDIDSSDDPFSDTESEGSDRNGGRRMLHIIDGARVPVPENDWDLDPIDGGKLPEGVPPEMYDNGGGVYGGPKG